MASAAFVGLLLLSRRFQAGGIFGCGLRLRRVYRLRAIGEDLQFFRSLSAPSHIERQNLSVPKLWLRGVADRVWAVEEPRGCVGSERASGGQKDRRRRRERLIQRFARPQSNPAALRGSFSANGVHAQLRRMHLSLVCELSGRVHT